MGTVPGAYLRKTGLSRRAAAEPALLLPVSGVAYARLLRLGEYADSGSSSGCCWIIHAGSLTAMLVRRKASFFDWLICALLACASMGPNARLDFGRSRLRAGELGWGCLGG